MNSTADHAALTAPYPFEDWLPPGQDLAYRDYWEDEAEERRKPYWILDGDFGKLERYIASTGRVQQLRECVLAAEGEFGRTIRGVGADLGGGVLWALPHILRYPSVDRVYGVEYSRHRLTRIAPAILRHYDVPGEKVVLALGDFHRLSLPDASLDFVFMCATFHHSDHPEALLREMRRVLRLDGLAILTGEHARDLTPVEYIKQPLRWIAARTVPKTLQKRLIGHTVRARRFLPTREELLETDDELGDHYYTHDQYDAFFRIAEFAWRRVPDPRTGEQSFVLVPRD